MRLRLVPVLLVLAAALAACAGPRTREPLAQASASDLDARIYGAPAAPSSVVRRAAAAVPAPVAMVDSGPYTLDSGDKVRVVVFGQDALSNTYTVDAQGQITLPLIGAVEARGRTTRALGSAIAGRLKEGYIRDPSVAVEVETYRPFFVLGEVTYPGQYPYVPNMTVESAVAIAGGFTPRAAKDTVTITRRQQGAPMRLKLPLTASIRPGDTIAVSERWF